MFTVAALILTALFLVQLRERIRARAAGLTAFCDFVQAERQHGLSGAFKARALDQNEAMTAGVAASIAKTRVVLNSVRRQGLGAEAALRQWLKLLRQAGALSKEQWRFWQIFFVRTMISLGAAHVGRAFLMVGAVDGSRASFEHLSLLLSCFVVVATHGVLCRLLPLSWLWGGRLSRLGLLWLESYSSAAAVSGLPVAQQLRAMERQELQCGVSLARERREVLSQWAAGIFAKEKAGMTKLEEFLPLLELLGLGLPALLILFEPLRLLLGK